MNARQLMYVAISPAYTAAENLFNIYYSRMHINFRWLFDSSCCCCCGDGGRERANEQAEPERRRVETISFAICTPLVFRFADLVSLTFPARECTMYAQLKCIPIISLLHAHAQPGALQFVEHDVHVAVTFIFFFLFRRRLECQPYGFVAANAGGRERTVEHGLKENSIHLQKPQGNRIWSTDGPN